MLDKIFQIYIDGAARGNPGPAGIGAVICQDGRVIKNLSSYIGKTTNNSAEYMALIFALQEALVLKAKAIEVFSDSQLLCRQLNGEYKVKEAHIKTLFTQVKNLLSLFKKTKIIYIPRQQNRGADKLANLALKQAQGKQLFIRQA